MRVDRIALRWTGVALALVTVVSTLWLTSAGKLTLYVHPRYTVFTAGMALLAGVVIVAGLVTRRERDDHEHPHHDDFADHQDQVLVPPSRSARATTVIRFGIVAAAVVALLVLPPATLSSTARQNRDLVTSGRALDNAKPPKLAGSNPASFTVKDWAALLRQGGPTAVLGQKVDVTGYVLDRGDADVFYAVRLVVSCCAVDAQPIGIPISRPGWRDELKAGSWISVQGTFAEQGGRGPVPVAVKVSSLTGIDEPAQPYVF